MSRIRARFQGERQCPSAPTEAVYWIHRAHLGKKVFDDSYEQPEVVLRDAPEGIVHPDVLRMIKIVGARNLMGPEYTSIRMASGESIQAYWEIVVRMRRAMIDEKLIGGCICAERERLMLKNRSSM